MIFPIYEDTSNAAELLVASESSYDKSEPITIIGVHGWLPEILQPVQNLKSQPFCEKLEVNLRKKLGLSPGQGDIFSIPLHGHGVCNDRSEQYLDQIKATPIWSQKMKNAKTVFIVGHSQGVPTSVLLLSRLLDEKLIDPSRQRVCVLLLAGISHGPAQKYNLLRGIAGLVRDPASVELFDFQNSKKLISRHYILATQKALKLGIKFLYFASGNDEVVPLHSALNSAIDHPSIMRGLFVSPTIYQEKRFPVELVQLLIQLRNHSLTDYGLLAHLSDSLMGYLKDEGHSHITTEDEVYTSAIRHLYETKTYRNVEMKINEYNFEQPANKNYIPWAMRGLVSDEKIIKSEKLGPALLKLRNDYSNWEPKIFDIAGKNLKLMLKPFNDIKEDEYIPVFTEPILARL
ncbi:hypothetical protein G9A89_006006 [Geosiphon pyriformis]|nr:hypothetical protein G9A89_006006 [Geosiphon pyriformis]